MFVNINNFKLAVMAVGDVVASLSVLVMDISVIKKLEIAYVHLVKLGQAAKLVRLSDIFLITPPALVEILLMLPGGLCEDHFVCHICLFLNLT